MESLLAIIGSLGTVGGAVGLFVLALRYASAKDDQREALLGELAAERAADAYRGERDAAVVARAAAEASAASALRQLSATQSALNVAREELVKHVRDRIEGVPVGDAVRIVDQLLGRDLSTPGDPAAGDDHGAPAAMSAPLAPPPGGAPRGGGG